MNRRNRSLSFAVALGLASALAAGAALGQQPGAAGQPPVRVQRIDPSQLPPSFQRPGANGQPGQGMPQGHPSVPGMPRIPGLPGLARSPGALPPGMKMPAGHPSIEEESEASEHGEEEHGHNEPPPPPNWWQGILMVNNELAESPSFVNKLLFRYENPKNPHDPKNQPPPFLASVLNFAIFAFIVYRFGRKPLADALVKRKTGIMAEIDAATELHDQAEARLREYKARFARIEETAAEMRRDFAAQAEREKATMLAEAEARRARMRRDAEFIIEQESKSAQVMLLQEAVEGAVSAAEALITAKAGPSDQDRLAEDYLSVVGATLAAPRASGSTAAPGGR